MKPVSFETALLQLITVSSLVDIRFGPTIVQPAKILIANGPPFLLATMSLGSIALGQLEPIKRPTLLLDMKGYMRSAISTKWDHFPAYSGRVLLCSWNLIFRINFGHVDGISTVQISSRQVSQHF